MRISQRALSVVSFGSSNMLSPVLFLDGHQVAASVEYLALAGDALLEGAHELFAEFGRTISAVKAEFAIVGAISVADQKFGCVEIRIAMEALVTRQFAQHTARHVLPVRIWNIWRHGMIVVFVIGISLNFGLL